MIKTCIVIAGPTAVGKTSTAIALAKQFSTEIISSDSRQCYTELGIGVAKPSPHQLAEVPHHFINSHSIHENISAADFEQYALHAVENIFTKSDFAVMVGGTGLYIKAFCDGLDDIPAADEAFRAQLKQRYQSEGIEWLANEVKSHDPAFYADGEMQNPQRMMRALEVMKASGKSILSYYTGTKKKRDFNVIKIGLELPRDLLYENINNRAIEMMDSGLLEEARELIQWRHLNPLQTVGYKEMFAYIDRAIPYEHAVNLIKQNTRHYAKRQMTWFKKDAGFTWLQPGDISSIMLTIEKAIEKK